MVSYDPLCFSPHRKHCRSTSPSSGFPGDHQRVGAVHLAPWNWDSNDDSATCELSEAPLLKNSLFISPVFSKDLSWPGYLPFRSSFYPRPSLSLTKSTHTLICSRQLNIHLINFLSSLSGYGGLTVFCFSISGEIRKPKPSSPTRGSALCPGVAWNRSQRGSRGQSKGSSPVAGRWRVTLSAAAAGHVRWLLLAPHRVFLRPLSTDCFTKGVCSWNFSIASRGSTSHRRVRSWGPSLQIWGVNDEGGRGVSLCSRWQWFYRQRSPLRHVLQPWSCEPENIFLKSKEYDRWGGSIVIERRESKVADNY